MGKSVLFINTTCTQPASLEVLRKSGYRVDMVYNADIGLRQLDAKVYDAVILQESPEAESWRLCRKIRQVAATPLIVISNHASTEACVKAIKAGADFFMRKPFGPLEFSARLQSLLQRRILAPQVVPIGR